jgi:hypothetical protein
LWRCARIELSFGATYLVGRKMDFGAEAKVGLGAEAAEVDLSLKSCW